MLTQTIRDVGPRGARIALVGEAGGEAEARLGVPFVGASGLRLAEWWRSVGLRREDLFITNVVQRRPRDNKMSDVPRDELEAWVHRLHETLATLTQPTVIVPTGNTALWALTGRGAPPWVKRHKGRNVTGITSHRGSIYSYRTAKGHDIKVIPTIHPAATFRTEGWVRRCRLDWARIATDAEFPELRLPEREFLINPTREDVRWLVREAARADCITIDIETPHTAVYVTKTTKAGKTSTRRTKGPRRITLVGFGLSAKRAVVVPVTEKYWGSADDVAWVWDQIRTVCALPVPKSMQNGVSFDRYWLKRVHDIDVVNLRWDTRWMDHCLDRLDDHDLAFQASIHTREPYWKDDTKTAGGEEAAEDEYDPDTYARYNGTDCTVQHELTDLHAARLDKAGRLDFYLRHYAALFDPMLAMMLGGMRVSRRAQRIESMRYRADIIEAQDALTAMAGAGLYGPRGSLSAKKLARFLYGRTEDVEVTKRQRDPETKKMVAVTTVRRVVGLGLPKRHTKGKVTTNEVVVRKLMLSHARQFGEAAALILDIRRKQKLTEFLNDGVADADGYVRSAYGFVDTLRFSAGKNALGTGQNAQNVDRDLRHHYLPDPGHLWLSPDLAQAESRIVYVLSGDARLIDIARAQPHEFDDHNRTAGLLFSDLKRDGEWHGIRFPTTVPKDRRYFGKKTRHAFDYGEGGDRMSDDILKDGIVKSPEECNTWLGTLAAQDPPIPRWWQRVRSTLMQYKRLANSWGDQIDYRWERLGDDLYRRAYAWQPQSEVPHIINQWGLLPLSQAIEAGAFDARILQQGHDSLPVSVAPADVYPVMLWLRRSLERPRWLTLAPEPWPQDGSVGVELTIPVTFTLGTTWAGGIEYKRFPTRAEVDADVRRLL